jgi:hypothetical protein
MPIALEGTSDELKSKLLMRVAELGLSSRSENALRAAKIERVGDLIGWPETSLLRLQNFGRKSLAEIKAKLPAELALGTSIIGWSTACPSNGGRALSADISRQIDFFQVSVDVKADLVRRIDEHELSIRSMKALEAAGIEYIGDLVQMSERKLMALANFGRTSLAEVKSRLPHPFSLGTTIVGWSKAIAEGLRVELGSLIDERRRAEAAEKMGSASGVGCLEEELIQLAKTFAVKPRHASMAAAFFGWDGTGRKTLETVGTSFGVTRERIRQVTSAFERRLRSQPLPLPKFDEVLAIIDQTAPAPWRDIETRLRAQGLLRSAFDPSGILSAADLSRREAACEIVETRSGRMIVRRTQSHLISHVERIARRLASRVGCVSIAEVADIGSTELKEPITPEFVRVSLRNENWAELDSALEWFWSPNAPRNRLVNQLRKIFSVAREVPIAELRSAVSRHHRMGGFAPPKRVLAAIVRQLPGLEMREETAVSFANFSAERTLGRVELAFYRCFIEHGPVMLRQKIEAILLGAGMNITTFQIYLANSSIITHLGPSLYALAGAEVKPSDLTRVLAEKHRGSARLDHGWTREGRPWISYKLNYGILGSGVVTIPTSLQNILEGEYRLSAADASEMGTLRVRGNFVWSLKRFFSWRGAEPEDEIVLIFDVSARATTVENGAQFRERLTTA